MHSRVASRTLLNDDQLEAGNGDQLAAGKETPSETLGMGLTICIYTGEEALGGASLIIVFVALTVTHTVATRDPRVFKKCRVTSHRHVRMSHLIFLSDVFSTKLIW